MATNSLGRLTLDLVLKAGAFTAGMTAAERQASKSLSAIEKRAYAFGRTVGASIKAGAVIVTAALGTIALAVGKAIDNADAIRDMSIQLGASTETLSAYAFAAQQTGTDLDALGRGMKLLAKNAADALKPTSEQAAIFDALGVSVTDAEGKLKSLEQLIPEIATQFASMEDGTTKTALALALFGKSGAELIEFLNQGGAGLDEFSDKARELGLIIDSETAASADDFNDTLDTLKAAVSGGALTLAEELLPALQKAASAFVRLVNEGDLARNMATALSGALSFGIGILDEYNNAVARSTIAIGFFVKAGDAMRSAATGGLLGQLSAIQQFNGALKEGQAELDALIKRQNNPFKDVTSRVLPGASAGGSGVNTAALNRALSGQRSGGGSKAKSGKSDEVREAEQLEEAYKRLSASMQEQIDLFGKEGEAIKIRYDLENGELAKLDPAKKQLLITQAEQIDQMRLMADLEEAATKASKDESDRILEGIAATDEVISNLEFELELLGKSNIERAKAIELRNLDANATDEQRAAVASLTEELIRASENQAFLDDFKEGLADAFVDFVSGAKSAKDAFGDFADQLFKRALQFVADKAIQAMFDSFSGGGSGGGQFSGGQGGGWGAIFGNLLSAFGGGRAGGGMVMPGKFYEVNESGMEMATVGGRDYLMTGSQSGMITPAHKLGGSVYNLNNTFVVPPGQRQRTQEQQAQKMGQQVQEITRRNG